MAESRCNTQENPTRWFKNTTTIIQIGRNQRSQQLFSSDTQRPQPSFKSEGIKDHNNHSTRTRKDHNRHLTQTLKDHNNHRSKQKESRFKNKGSQASFNSTTQRPLTGIRRAAYLFEKGNPPQHQQPSLLPNNTTSWTTRSANKQ